MIIYENTLAEFINQCNQNVIADEVANKMKLYGLGFGEGEKNSWTNSLPFVAGALDDDSVSKDINVAIEYKSQMNKSRMDFLVYGKNDKDEDSVVIVELKQWSDVKNSKKPNYVFTMGGGGEKDYFHPSYQAYRYESILKGFNEFVQDEKTDIESCSYLHNLDNVYSFVLDDETKFPFVNESPVFYKDDQEKLREFVKKYVTRGNRKLLYEIDNSNIRPSKEFSNMLYDALQGKQIFSLDDNQAASVATIIYETNYSLEHRKRKTIIIKGGPGSGKSVVAVNAMGQLIHPSDGSAPKNAVYCTTNFTPRTLMKELLVDGNYKKNAIENLFKTIASFSRCREFDYDCILMDEAHRAFTWKFGQGVKRDVDMIDRVFYASRVNVWFIDEDQMVTKDDYLTIERIKEYAVKYNSEIVEMDELKLTTQFRCLGGNYYIEFINSFLGYDDHIKKYLARDYDFRVFDTPGQMWQAIQQKQEQYPNSRLLAGYTHDWISKSDDSVYDFVMDGGSFKMRWNKSVSFSYINDNDQLDRIGSIHTIQGVDMAYGGVIIGKDMKYRNGKIVFDKSENAKTDTASGIRNADDKLAEKLIRNTYKVLLTRAIYGTYVYCEDEALNDYLKSFLPKQGLE